MNNSEIKKRILCVLALILATVYLCWRAFFTLPFEYGVFSIIVGIALFLAEFVGIISGSEHLMPINKKHLPKLQDIPLDKYPDVDVFIATHNELPELVYKTVNGCLNMDYPDKGKVHIYICDDTEREEMRELAAKMNVGYCGVKDNKLAKAGNLNYALSQTKSPLVATFDADMIPLGTFLMETVPYFFDEDGNEKKVGFIQTPQSFYNADLFQYNLYSEDTVPNEQNFFFREVNIVRNRTNTPIYAGSNTLLSRKALEEVGGIAEGLITEDFATGVRIQKKGYRCYATDKVKANGLAPNDLKSLIKQRERWARGCIQTLRKENIIFAKDLKFSQKISYLESLLYWYNPLCRLMYIVSPILFGLFNVYVVKYTFQEMLLMWLPYFLIYNYAIKYTSGNIRNSRLSNLYDTIMFPYLLIPIILETMGIQKKKFAVTAKDNSNIGKSTLKYGIPHIVIALVSLIALVRCSVIAISIESPYYIVIILWLAYNLYSVVMAIFFVLGRKIERTVERFAVNIDVEIDAKYGHYVGKTVDVSDNGLSVLVDFPEYIDDDEIVTIRCKTEKYVAELQATVVYFTNSKDKFKFAFAIQEIDEANKRNYLNIIYDREPSLPSKIQAKSSVYGEFSSNIHKRFAKYQRNARRLARIDLFKKLKTKSGINVLLYNFNYEYVCVGFRNVSEAEEMLEIILDDGLVLKGKKEYEKKNNNDDGKIAMLYKVTNMHELLMNENFRVLLEKWIQEYREYYEEIERKRVLKEKSNEDELDEMEYIWGGNMNV